MPYEIYSPCARRVAGVLFDMDGVVLDTEKLYARFWQEAAIALGYPMTWQQALGMRSRSRQAGQAQLDLYFGPGVSHAALREKRIELMDAYIAEHGVEAKPGIHALLDRLDELGIPKAIATSSPMERICRYLEPLGLLTRFDALCTGYDVPHGKPAPDIYLHAAAAIGVAPEMCLALEDSPAGVQSAVSAGCRCVLIPDQDQPDEETRALLFGCADSLLDIVSLLEGECL